ncbi:YmfQ family protein [Chromobacterium sp. IIBBL 290-4]|uniref:YmfQ family protein n=1 Tax=Chromobacterium sp. IIBBL 290-4 TaxID=2953890 RepID=UPI0020B63E2D|nr:putative phage tail protein [Chromobacterium sp. IIBBL 290-4]UTH76015.1 DUF2313 domain-containing protein [Chromobacterium sp. IIBBL 290-4]
MTPSPSNRELLSQLLPPASYSPDAPRLSAELSAEGAALDRAQLSSTQLAGAVTALQPGPLLPDWERICGLTPPPDATYQQRLQSVRGKLAETGGLSKNYFIQLAKSLGYDIDISELQPFRAGLGRAGEQVWSGQVIWQWRVTVHGSKGGMQTYRFRAGQSLAGERLTAFGDPRLEDLINDLKPAHTYVYFAYQA